MRIATYNVLGLTGYPPRVAAGDLRDTERTVAHFAAVFSGLGCDVLALQEGPSLETMRRIATALGMHLAAFPSPTAYPGYVLSRAPIRESRAYAHPGPGAQDGPFSRHAGAALLEFGAHGLWVVDVHLHPHDLALRERETEGLRGHLQALAAGEAPVVVLGDCNSEPGAAVHRLLAGLGFGNALERVGGGAAPTMDTAGVRPLAIDHIYVSPPLVERLAAARVVRDPGFRSDAAQGWVHSDHLPVVAELRWP